MSPLEALKRDMVAKTTSTPTQSIPIHHEPHRRRNPLNGRWIICSPQRVLRPWNGETNSSKPSPSSPQAKEETSSQNLEQTEYLPSCHLCPGNIRTSLTPNIPPAKNAHYKDTWVFRNDFPALLKGAPSKSIEQLDDDTPERSLFQVTSPSETKGDCHVILYSANHSLSMAHMSVEGIRNVISKWEELFSNMTRKENPSSPDANGEWTQMAQPASYVLIFENKGAIMGCSNPHPHGQVWSSSGFIPQEPLEEMEHCQRYYEKHGACLLCDYAHIESEAPLETSRIVCQNESFMAVVPYWALWPFETLVVPRRHLTTFEDFSEAEKADLASLLKRLLVRYDRLFDCSFPYSMGIHQTPASASTGCSGGCHEKEFNHWHMHFNPPLLRNSEVKKFQVGFEMFGELQRDITPEMAASRLRSCSEE
jgi:UDPglucose--hexose-1-phosphate uridylyltransferase